MLLSFDEMSAIVSDDAEAAAHRLRDLVQRVDLAVRERDVLEDVRARRGDSSTRPTAGAAVGACVGHARQLARRLLRWRPPRRPAPDTCR